MKRWLADGAQLETVEWRGNKIYTVTVDLTKDFRITTFPNSLAMPMVVAPPTGQGLASIGADFKCDYGPCHLYVRDREIWTTGSGRGGVVFVSNQRQATIARSQWSVNLFSPDVDPVKIDRVNHGIRGNAAFTARGGTIRMPLDGRHYLTMRQASDWELLDDGASVRMYEVIGKTSEIAPVVVEGQVVIETLHELPHRLGSYVKWRQWFGLSDATDVVGGMTQLVKDGSNVAPIRIGGSGSLDHDGYYYNPCPRAGLGVIDDHTASLFVVDGRPANQDGIQLHKLGRFLRQERGVRDAMNMDGGGSAVMWTADYGVVSEPSYGVLRPVIYSTAVV